MMRTVVAALVTLAAFVPAVGVAAPVCPTIEFAALQAVGSKHASAQYVAYLNTSDANPSSIAFSVGFTGAIPASPTRVVLNPSGSPFGRKAPAIIFVTPKADVAWIRIVGIRQESARYTDCSSTPRYAIKPTKVEEPAFDDGASWVKPYTVLQFAGAGQATVLARENAASRGLSGSSRIVAVVGADGVVKDAALLEPSGDAAVDEAAVKAAMQTRFSAARLPDSAGGQAIPSVVDFSVTFAPGTVSVHVH